MSDTVLEVEGQVKSVERGQEVDKVKFGKGKMTSTICMDSQKAAKFSPGDGIKVRIEVDAKLFDEG